jgi:hypothetical protein
MDRKLTWNDLGLSWDGETPQGEGNVVVGKFGKKE